MGVVYSDRRVCVTPAGATTWRPPWCGTSSRLTKSCSTGTDSFTRVTGSSHTILTGTYEASKQLVNNGEIDRRWLQFGYSLVCLRPVTLHTNVLLECNSQGNRCSFGIVTKWIFIHGRCSFRGCFGHRYLAQGRSKTFRPQRPGIKPMSYSHPYDLA